MTVWYWWRDILMEGSRETVENPEIDSHKYPQLIFLTKLQALLPLRQIELKIHEVFLYYSLQLHVTLRFKTLIKENYDQWTSNINITWQRTGNVESQTISQIYWIRNCIFTKSFGNRCIHKFLRSTALDNIKYLAFKLTWYFVGFMLLVTFHFIN